MSKFQMITLTAALFLALWLISRRQPTLREAGPFPPPQQLELSLPTPLSAPQGFHIQATDEYTVEAEILSRRHYRRGIDSELSPVDFVLGWGRLTLEPQISAVRYSQRGRWYEYHWGSDLAIPSVEIPLCTANTHIIPNPSDKSLRDRLLSLQRGDCVRLQGYLVRVTGPNGWHWNSSRTRSDRGAGSCEVLYVTSCDFLL